MRNSFLLLVSFLLLLEWGGCVSLASPTIQSSDAHETPNGVLINVNGIVRLKRRGWNQFEVATENTPLYRGDLLHVEENSRAIILCANSTRKSIPFGFSGVPCSNSKAEAPSLLKTLLISIFSNISFIGPTRGDQPEDVPIIVAPRRGKILNQHPILRWVPPIGITSPVTYKVSLMNRGIEIWRAEVQGEAQIQYPAKSAPDLKPGETYRLVVEIGNCALGFANNCSSDKETQPGRGFTLLTEDAAKKVREMEAAIYSLQLEPKTTRFLIGRYYASQGLYAEAISQLEETTETLREPATEQSLGDLYFAIGLTRFAEKHFVHALSLSKSAEDVEGQAKAARSLGRVYIDIGNFTEAVIKLMRARDLYNQLGNKTIAVEIQNDIDRWRAPQIPR